jgi:hypothetical protein
MQFDFIGKYQAYYLLLLFITASCQKEESNVDLSLKENILNLITAEKNIQEMNSVAFCVVKMTVYYGQMQWVMLTGINIYWLLRKHDTLLQAFQISNCTAIMQLYDMGLFELDEDIINTYLFILPTPNHLMMPLPSGLLM